MAWDLSRQQARWSLFLSQFDFQLSYKARTTNHADALFRHPDLNEGVESDNKAQTLLPSKLFTESSKTLVEPSKDRHVKATEIISLDILSLIQHSHAGHNLLVNVALNKLLEKGPQAMKRDLGKWTHQDRVTRRNGYTCMPKDDLLQWMIVRTHHDTMATGHLGQAKTLELVQHHYWWPSMTKFVHQYVDGCTICQSTRNLPHRTYLPIQPLETMNVPWCFV